LKTFILTFFALLAFAGNSVLCRMALSSNAMGTTSIDANSFTIIRLLSGALVLGALLLINKVSLNTLLKPDGKQVFLRAAYLFIYAAFFSYAYILLDTAAGALLLFASVQITMLSVQFISQKKPSNQELSGLLLAFMGFVYWMLPSSQSPSYLGAALMIISGIAWAAYTLAGKGSKHAQLDTAQNFIYSLPFLIFLLPVYFIFEPINLSEKGIVLAVLSGAITSGLGYWIWYQVLPKLSISSAAVLQLSVPLIAAGGGILWNHESITASFIMACSFILLGIYLVISSKKRSA